MSVEKKSRILKAIRDYFDKTQALEVITDILRPYPNLDSNVYPLKVEFFDETSAKKIGYLHTSPELEMKKILSKEKRDIYQITKVFRNYEGSRKHKVEFTMLEWYRVGYNLDDLMEDTKNIFIEACISIHKKTKVEYLGKVYDLSNWEKITVDEAFYRYAGVYPDDYLSMERAVREKINYRGNDLDYETLFFLLYSHLVEPKLGKDKPVFIYDYPPSFSALAKIENGKGKRFEAYINGLELVNGYYEENNPSEIEKRFLRDIKQKFNETGEKYPVDKDFLKSLKSLPECSGASLGVDRLFMVLLNKDNIKSI
jgi:lysyl-tRNA synthetase class 2